MLLHRSLDLLQESLIFFSLLNRNNPTAFVLSGTAGIKTEISWVPRRQYIPPPSCPPACPVRSQLPSQLGQWEKQAEKPPLKVGQPRGRMRETPSFFLHLQTGGEWKTSNSQMPKGKRQTQRWARAAVCVSLGFGLILY